MKKIYLSFLWHMHQPPYKEPREKMFIMPWVYLHAIKDYYDMGKILVDYEKIVVNINFVPSLLFQLKDYIEEKAKDNYIILAKKHPSELTEVELKFILTKFFSGNRETMLYPYPRYRELYELVRSSGSIDFALKLFTHQDIMDLQLWFFLSWCGKSLREDKFIEKLFKKGRGFTEEEKIELFQKHSEFLKKLQKLYIDLLNAKKVEISTSPFFHPILPLLYDTESAKRADAKIKIGTERFSAPDEVERQIKFAVLFHERVFGSLPSGLWPPEGALSEEIFPYLKKFSFRWTVTDEFALKEALGKKYITNLEKSRPYIFNDIAVFFRNQFLSDQIGFVYSKWNVEDAVKNFIDEIKKIRDEIQDERGIVLIALDGENAWEFYPDGGYNFLSSLYSTIEKTDFIEPITLSEYLNRNPQLPELDKFPTCSWINGNLNTWIGDDVKNKAWDYLSNTYKIFKELRKNEIDPSTLDLCSEIRSCLLKAEASDWFWWYGKGHSSPNEPDFDYLFRSYLKACYEEMNISPPSYLDEPLGGEFAIPPIQKPLHYIYPQITGKKDHYYKWSGAGKCEIFHGALQKLSPLIKTLYYGYNPSDLCFCVEGFEPIKKILEQGLWIKFRFITPFNKAIWVILEESKIITIGCDEGKSFTLKNINTAVDETLEICIPSSFFGLEKSQEKTTMEFFIEIWKSDKLIDRFPWNYNIEFIFDPVNLDTENWYV